MQTQHPCHYAHILHFRNANKQYRASLLSHDLSLSLSPPFAFFVYPPSLRATTTIYIVTGGAVLYSPFTSPGQISDGEIFTDEYPRAKYPQRRGRRGVRACIRSVRALEIAPPNARAYQLFAKNLHVRDRQFYGVVYLVRYRSPFPPLRLYVTRSVGPVAICIRGVGGGGGKAAGFNAHASCIFKAPAWYSCTRKLNPNARLLVTLSLSLRFSRRLSLVARALYIFPSGSSVSPPPFLRRVHSPSSRTIFYY